MKNSAIFLKFSLLFLALGAAIFAIAYAHSYFGSTKTPEATLKAGPVVAIPEADALSTTTPVRVINALSIKDTIPPAGKFIAADLVEMKLYLYENGTTTAVYPIKTKGKPGTPWETPTGFYVIQTKERSHFSSIGKVYMPYSMQFYGNYFIHGWTYYPDGSPTPMTFSGGCIKLATEDAQKVFEFADVGTKVFVYDAKQALPPPPLALASISEPSVKAAAYLVADIDTGAVYAEKNATEQMPITSATKLMTALVANEVISLNKKVALPEGYLSIPRDEAAIERKTFLVDDLFYPLLMQSNNDVADALSTYYGKTGFVTWMNTTAAALDMASTTFKDASGASPENLSNTEDLFRLATYLANKKSFVLRITRTQMKTITAVDGSEYKIENADFSANASSSPSSLSIGETAPSSSALSVITFSAGENVRRAAVIVLGSEAQKQDIETLSKWLSTAVSASSQEACVSCSQMRHYRTIQL